MEAKRNLSYKLSKWLNGTSWTDEKARSLTERLCGSYANEIGVNYNERCGMPQREAIFNVLEQLLDLVFPGYTGKRSFTTTEQYFAVGSMVNDYQNHYKLMKACIIKPFLSLQTLPNF